ncbi:hypothetical protein JTB14_003767 [Gonioctena quinquepunctata]|nr:hypothetical protein JTB14_003767 [Gonioctena quinquepunctata]
MSLDTSTPVSAFSMYKKQSQNKQKKKRADHTQDAPPAKKSKEDSKKQKLQNGHGPIKPKHTNKVSENSKKVTNRNCSGPSEEPKTKKKIKRIKPIRVESPQNATVEEEDQPPMLVPISPSVETTPKDTQEDSSVTELISELNKTDPSPEGLKLFKWLIAPLTPAKFFDKYWESEALHISRCTPNYYSHILSTQRLDDIFREFPLYYSRNVDVVSYENGVKEVHNEDGRVVASGLYDYYSNGCSIRVLNPHTYDQKVHLLLATLQEYFGTMVGANVYLTPPGSQGFAPHYDDIEAFIVQLEGRKHWKLYKPKGSDILARNSSHNFKPEDIGEPFMEVTLNAGDLLYFPRGTIHEGRTDEEAHSLHITVSVYQRNSYADLLEHILPVALKKAAAEDLEFRRGLPLHYLKHIGHVNTKTKSREKKAIKTNVRKLMRSLADYVDVDGAADQLGRKFMYDSMPPVLSKQEVNYTSKYDGDYMKDGKICNRVEIGMDTEVRLVRYHCLRLVVEEDVPKIYYNTENAKVYHGEEEQFLTVDHGLIPCIEKLQKSYPRFIRVENLPVEDSLAKAQLVSDFWERGLLVTNGPLMAVSDGEGESDESDVEYGLE